MELDKQFQAHLDALKLRARQHPPPPPLHITQIRLRSGHKLKRLEYIPSPPRKRRRSRREIRTQHGTRPQPVKRRTKKRRTRRSRKQKHDSDTSPNPSGVSPKTNVSPLRMSSRTYSSQPQPVQPPATPTPPPPVKSRRRVKNRLVTETIDIDDDEIRVTQPPGTTKFRCTICRLSKVPVSDGDEAPRCNGCRSNESVRCNSDPYSCLVCKRTSAQPKQCHGVQCCFSCDKFIKLAVEVGLGYRCVEGTFKCDTTFVPEKSICDGCRLLKAICCGLKLPREPPKMDDLDEHIIVIDDDEDDEDYERDLEPEPECEPEHGVGPAHAPQPEPDPEQESESELEVGTEREPEPEAQPELEIDPEPILEAHLEPESQTELESGSDTELEPVSEPELEVESTPEIESEIEPELAPEIESDPETEIEPQPESEPEMVDEPEDGLGSESGNENQEPSADESHSELDCSQIPVVTIDDSSDNESQSISPRIRRDSTSQDSATSQDDATSRDDAPTQDEAASQDDAVSQDGTVSDATEILSETEASMRFHFPRGFSYWLYGEMIDDKSPRKSDELQRAALKRQLQALRETHKRRQNDILDELAFELTTAGAGKPNDGRNTRNAADDEILEVHSLTFEPTDNLSEGNTTQTRCDRRQSLRPRMQTLQPTTAAADAVSGAKVSSKRAGRKSAREPELNIVSNFKRVVVDTSQQLRQTQEPPTHQQQQQQYQCVRRKFVARRRPELDGLRAREAAAAAAASLSMSPARVMVLTDECDNDDNIDVIN